MKKENNEQIVDTILPLENEKYKTPVGDIISLPVNHWAIFYIIKDNDEIDIIFKPVMFWYQIFDNEKGNMVFSGMVINGQNIIEATAIKNFITYIDSNFHSENDINDMFEKTIKNKSSTTVNKIISIVKNRSINAI